MTGRSFASFGVMLLLAGCAVPWSPNQVGYWLQALEERAESLTITAAQMLVKAHIRSEEAEDASRAVRMAKHGETWTPFVLQDEAEVLFFGGRKIG
jgi:hypothetical protein